VGAVTGTQEKEREREKQRRNEPVGGDLDFEGLGMKRSRTELMLVRLSEVYTTS